MNHMQPGIDARYPQEVTTQEQEDFRRQVYDLKAQVNLQGGRPKMNGPMQGPPDHLSVQGAINLIGNDMRQLLENISDLRAKLSPMLAERESSNRPLRPGLPVACKMAAELSDIHSVVQNARELVEITLLQLDL